MSLKLHKIMFTHFSQKDSRDGIHSYVIANDESQVLEVMSNFIYFEDWEQDGDEGDVSPCRTWWEENPNEVQRATDMGLTVHPVEWGDDEGKPDWVSGPKVTLCKWWRGDPTEPSDLYYGWTTWRWDQGTPISEEEAKVLVATGVASRL